MALAPLTQLHVATPPQRPEGAAVVTVEFSVSSNARRIAARARHELSEAWNRYSAAIERGDVEAANKMRAEVTVTETKYRAAREQANEAGARLQAAVLAAVRARRPRRAPPPRSATHPPRARAQRRQRAARRRRAATRRARGAPSSDAGPSPAPRLACAGAL
jgi:hypothetical protein